MRSLTVFTSHGLEVRRFADKAAARKRRPVNCWYGVAGAVALGMMLPAWLFFVMN